MDARDTRAKGGNDGKYDKRKREGVSKNIHNAARHTMRRKYDEKLRINEFVRTTQKA